MKTKYMLLTALMVSFSLISFAGSSSDTIKVWGNCDMCKGKIEKAAKDAGATNADWNKDTKMLTVSYDDSKTNKLGIEKKIAAAGYDTQDIKAADKAYNKLEKCCQYKRDTSANGMSDMKSGNGMKCDMKNMDKTMGSCCKDSAACGNSKECTPDMQCCKDKEKSCSSCKEGGCCKSAMGKGYGNIGSSCYINSKEAGTKKTTGTCCM